MEEIKEAWANGNFTYETADQTLQVNSSMLGNIRGLERAVDLIRGEDE